MRTGLAIGALASLLSVQVARGDNEIALGTLEGRIVEGATLTAIEGATIIVTDSQRGPVVASGMTDPNGQFHYNVPPGTYDILGIFGDARWIHLNSKVERNKITQVPGALSLDAEIVTVHEQAPNPEHRAPEAIRATVKPILPYSDQAINENIWAVGWMLVDVNEKGIVTAFRFLHRPGYGLDEIAATEIWGLRFKPAVDAAGQPMSTKVLWKLEWPAFHYSKQHKLVGLGGEGALTSAMEGAARNDLVANHFPTGTEIGAMDSALGIVAKIDGMDSSPLGPADGIRGALLGGLGPGQFLLPDGDHKPPCNGSGPMNLDMHESTYRDCTPPDLGNVNSETLVKRPEN
jgi:hypothetical protein